MDMSRILIAKTGKTASEWLPLAVHLEDTAGIMQCMIRDMIPPSFPESCALSPEAFEKTAVFLAYVHDIGKAMLVFQYKISRNLPEMRSRLEHFQLQFPESYEKDKINVIPHAQAGEEILVTLGCPESVAAVAGAHHGMPSEHIQKNLMQPRRNIKFYENYYGYAEGNVSLLTETWNHILQRALQIARIDSVQELPVLTKPAQMLLSGLLIMADWIASNTDYFPLIPTDEDIPENPERIADAWETIQFPEMWKSARLDYSDEAFRKNFSFAPRLVQTEFLNVIKNIESPGICILEAPMGCGKTEAALAGTEILAAKCRKNGMFFGLPTQATANGIFPRMMQWGEKQSQNFYHSIQLKHGSSALNTCFQKIQRGIPEQETDSGLIVHSWFCDNKKACLADFVVATVDQMLMMALKRKHVMLLHVGLSEKVVVIDEVHAYDAYMNEYLEMALQWLGYYKTPVILLSATLPASRRMSLVRAYLGIRESEKAFENEMGYPLLTWTDGTEIRQKRLTYQGAHTHVQMHPCTEDAVLAVVQNVVEHGGCVGVIVNTVKRAQTFAEEIRNQTHAKVLLYHAQFIFPDRTLKEQALLKTVGKDSSAEDRRGTVVVGTQVLEQSLDIDFDLLITDICPMDLLLQRIGRLHRHAFREQRPEVVKTPVCYVIMDELHGENTASKKIYGDFLLHRTEENLPESIVLPDDISPLVQAVYTFSEDDAMYQTYHNQQEIQKRRARCFRIGKPTGKDIHRLLSRDIEDKNECEVEAAVRDGISSIEVLLMRRMKDGSICFLPNQHGGRKTEAFPDEAECREIAEQKLRLPTVFSQKWSIDRTIHELEKQCLPYVENWQNSHWLKGQLVLFLDEEMNGELMGFQLHYSFENGLEYWKAAE